MEARVGIEPTIEVLQTSALPLGYRAAIEDGKDCTKRGEVKLKFVKAVQKPGNQVESAKE